MLRLMRDHATSWMIKFLLGAIVIVFVFWGVGSWRSQKMNVLAQVNGERISIDEYRQAYNNMVERLRQNFGDRLDEDLLEQLQVRQQALETLINQKLMLQEAQRLDIRVPDQELADTIRQLPAFQRGGVFDRRAYEQVLARNHLSPEEFETLQRESMLIERLRSVLNSNTKVSQAEVLEWYNWKNAAVNIEYVLFPPDGEDGDIAAPAPEDIEAYFKEHSEAYKTEPQVKARYLVFHNDTYRSQVEVTDEEIADYYESHKDEFKQEKTVDARHILFKLGPDATEEAVEAARQKALDVMTQARQGTDFAELAKKYSEGPTKDRGGHLGAFTRDKMVKPFSDKAFSMAAGEISEPVRTRFGWHIIKVEKVSEEKQQTLDEATASIRRKLADEKSKARAREEAEMAFDTSFESDDLQKTAAALKLEILTTDFFPSSGPKGIRNRTKFGEVAFGLGEGEISEIQDLGDGYYILQPVEKHPEQIPALSEVKDRVEKDLLAHRKDEKARMAAETFLTALQSKDEGNPKPEAEFKETGFFKRNASIPQIGYEQKINAAAFELKPESPLADEILKGRKGYYVIRLKERQAPDAKGLDAEKDDIRRNLQQQKEFKTFEKWIALLRDRSEVVIEEKFFQ